MTSLWLHHDIVVIIQILEKSGRNATLRASKLVSFGHLSLKGAPGRNVELLVLPNSNALPTLTRQQLVGQPVAVAGIHK